MNREEKDTRLKNLKELLEMYLSSQLLLNEIFSPLKTFLREKEINTKLSEKTGKILNSIYRDKNTSVSFNVAMFLRYWSALLEIYDENQKDKEQLPDLVDLVKKYQEVITAISQIEGEVSFDEAIDRHQQLMVEVVSFYEKNPISSEKRPKIEILNALRRRTDIQLALSNKQVQERKERMFKVE